MNTAIRSKTNKILTFICTLAMMIGIISAFGFRSIDANAVLERTLNAGENSVVTYVAAPNAVRAGANSSSVIVKRMGLTCKFMLYVPSEALNSHNGKIDVHFIDNQGKIVMILHVIKS